VRGAQRALDVGNVNLVLPVVFKAGEQEVVDAFDKVVQARQMNATCREVADRYFLETVVRVHRAGEGAPFTGLKPAGLDAGPVIPVGEKAIENEAEGLGRHPRERCPGRSGKALPPSRGAEAIHASQQISRTPSAQSSIAW
jgi:hypothetical protein